MVVRVGGLGRCGAGGRGGIGGGGGGGGGAGPRAGGEREGRGKFNIKCVWISSTTFFSKYFSFYKTFSEILQQMYIGLHVGYPLFLSDFKQTEFSRRIFEKKKIPSKLYKNLYSGNQVVPCGRTDRKTRRI